MKCFFLLLLASPAFGWWCEGHQVIAMIARNHMTPAALAGATALLRSQPIDSELRRFCPIASDDALADASTWADDAKKPEQTATWHYLDIPLGQKHGDLEQWCKPVGPVTNGKDRKGCVLSALRYNLNVLHNDQESDAERAKALRYLIHLVGDVHQPLHTTANNDQGGNCLPIRFFSNPETANLHSVWDGMIFIRDLVRPGTPLAQVAKMLDAKFEDKRKAWTKHGIDFAGWVKESHEIAQKEVYGRLDPSVKTEPFEENPSCKLQAEKFAALHLQVTEAYQQRAAPIVEEQIARAGYRLAEVLNQVW